jgi:curved DNA-binding protein CbpA
MPNQFIYFGILLDINIFMNKNLKQFYLDKLQCETVGHYAVMGLGSNATPDEIKAAYRRAVMATHPDRFPGSEEHDRAFKEVNAANEVLSDPNRRRTYDRDLDLQIVSDIDSAGWRQREVPAAAHTRLPKYERPQEKPAEKIEPRSGSNSRAAATPQVKTVETPKTEEPSGTSTRNAGQSQAPTQEKPATSPQVEPTGPELDPQDWGQFSGVKSGRSERTLGSAGYVSPRDIRAERERAAGFLPSPSDVGPRRPQTGSDPRDVGSSGFGQVQSPSGPLTPDQNRGVSRGFTERPIQERYISSLRKMMEAAQDANEKAKMVADQLASTMRKNGATPEEIERMKASGAPERLSRGRDGTSTQKPSSTKKPTDDSRYKR